MTADYARAPRVSVVLPIYDERLNLAPLIAEITTALADVPHEIVAVNDGSTDGSLAELERLSADFQTLRIVALERRSGQSAALTAGFDRARAPLIATLDADGQNAPTDLLRMLEPIAAGAVDAVVGVRIRRIDSRWKRFQAGTANWIRDRITGDHVRDTGCGIRLMRANAARAVPRFQGMHRFMPTLLRREGARVVEMEVHHRTRVHGHTKYGMWDRIFVGLWDAWGIRWLLRRRLPDTISEESANDQ